MFQEAANSASKLQNFLDIMERCRLVLATAASAEQEEVNIRSRIEPHKQQLEAIDAQIVARTSALAEIEVKIEEARTQAAQVVADAAQIASAKLTELDVAASRHKTETAARTQAAKAEVESAVTELARVNGLVSSANAELEAVQKKIAAAKSAAIAALS